MVAVWMRARSEFRSRWRALVSLALIAGLGAGAAIAAVAGARRTVSAYPRFRAATHAFDSLIGTTGDTQTDAEQLAILYSIRNSPLFSDWTMTDGFACTVTGPTGAQEAFPDLFPVASPDGRLGTTLASMKILSGRPADPARADEAVLTSFEADRLDAKVGSTLTLTFPRVTRVVHVVGVGIAAGTVDPAAGGYIPLLLLTPAFYAQNTAPDQRLGPSLVVRLKGGLDAVPQLQNVLGKGVSAQVGVLSQNSSVRRTAVFQSAGLLLFGGLALLTVLAIFAQLLARQTFLESADNQDMRALGMSRSQLIAVSFIRVGVVAAGAAAVAVAVAIATSPLFPIGFMHQLEVSPGVRLDGVALSVGALGAILLIFLAGLYPALRSSGARSAARGARGLKTNKAANILAGAAFPPTAVAGVRMALEPGRGPTAVPVRTTIFGTALALTALTASLSFGASLQRLVSTPRLSGWNFDAVVISDNGKQMGERLRSLGIASSYATGDNPDMKVGGLVINALTFAPGSFGPSVVAGRRPEGTTEIALGTKTLRTLHLSIGKTVSVAFLGGNNSDQPSGPSFQMRIVGSVITPQFFFSQAAVDNSAVVSQDVVDAIDIPDHPKGGASTFVRFAPGVSVGDGIARIRKLGIGNLFVLRRSASSDLANLQRISSLPNVLAGLLALVAAGTLVHTLTSSVRRRRRDLAILRALGFMRRQVRLAVVWQATTIIAISLAIGLPLGVVAGRWAWRVFVDQLGYVPLPIVPLLEVSVLVPAGILLANVIASAPARAAARIEPAVALRTE